MAITSTQSQLLAAAIPCPLRRVFRLATSSSRVVAAAVALMVVAKVAAVLVDTNHLQHSHSL